MHRELYKRYRPQTLTEVVGQPEATLILRGFFNNKRVPHTTMFTGDSGCGKTTLARIVADHVGAYDENLEEINAAESRGIDTVRDIQSRMRFSPLGADARAYIIDECHALTKDAQTAFLKILEDTPKHVYFMLCTTDPQKLLSTIRSRATEIKVKPLSNDVAQDLVEIVISKEKLPGLSAEVMETLLDVSDGAPRKLLVNLEAISELKDDAAKITYLKTNDAKAKIDALLKPLMWERPTWAEVCKIINTIEETEWEGFRRLVLKVATTMMLKGERKDTDRYYLIINAFADNWFDMGKAGLVRACYEVVDRSGRK